MVDRLVAKLLFPFVVQIALPWIYIWIGRPDRDDIDRSGALTSAIELSVTAVGNILPKSDRYSNYFMSHGMPSLATELVRVYGFCTLLFLACVVAYFGWASFFETHSSKSDSGDTKRKATKSDITARFAIFVAILDAYSVFIGYGLTPLSHFGIPGESTTGEYVIGLPIFKFALLLLIIVFLHQKRLGNVR